MSFATRIDHIVSCIRGLEELCVQVDIDSSTPLVLCHTVRTYLIERSQRDLTPLSLAIHCRKQLRANLLPTDDAHIRLVLAMLLVSTCGVAFELLIEGLRNPPEHCNADAVVDALVEVSRTDSNATEDLSSGANVPRTADTAFLYYHERTNATLTCELQRACPCAFLHVIAFATDHALLLTELPSEHAPRSYRSLLLSLGAAVTDAMAYYTTSSHTHHTFSVDSHPSHSSHGGTPTLPLPRQPKRMRYTLQRTVDASHSTNEQMHLGGGAGMCVFPATAIHDASHAQERSLDALALPEPCITSIRAQHALTVTIPCTHAPPTPDADIGAGTCAYPDASQWLLSRTTPSHLTTASAHAVRVPELRASDPSFAPSLQRHIRAGAPALLRGLVPTECMCACGYDPIPRPDTQLQQRPSLTLHPSREVVVGEVGASSPTHASTDVRTAPERGARARVGVVGTGKYTEVAGTTWRVGQFASLLGPRWVPIESGVYTHSEYNVHIAPLHRHWQHLAAMEHHPSTHPTVADSVGQARASPSPCVAAAEQVPRALAPTGTDTNTPEASTTSSSSFPSLSSAASSQQTHLESPTSSSPTSASAPRLPLASPMPYLAQHDIFSQCLSLSARIGLSSSLPAPLARAPTHAYALPASQAIALERHCHHVHWISARAVAEGALSMQSMCVGRASSGSHPTHARAHAHDEVTAGTAASRLWGGDPRHTTPDCTSTALASIATHTHTIAPATCTADEDIGLPRHRRPLPWASTSTHSLWADEGDEDAPPAMHAQAASTQRLGGDAVRGVSAEVGGSITATHNAQSPTTTLDMSHCASPSSSSSFVPSASTSSSSTSPSPPHTHTSTGLRVFPAELMGCNRVRPRLPLAWNQSLRRSRRPYGDVAAVGAGAVGAVGGDALWEGLWSCGVAEHAASGMCELCAAGDAATRNDSEGEQRDGGVDDDDGVASSDGDGDDDDDGSVVAESWRAWAGPAGTYTPLHYDAMDNVLFQVVGTKRVLLLPPERVASIQKFCSCCSDTVTLTRRETQACSSPSTSEQQKVQELTKVSSYSLPVDAAGACTRCNLVIESKETFNTATVDEEDARASGWHIELDLCAGDALFIPTGWWHSVRAYTPSLSFNYWWQ